MMNPMRREKKVIPAASREEKSKIEKERTNTPSCLFLFCLARAFGGTGALEPDFVRSNVNDFQAACLLFVTYFFFFFLNPFLQKKKKSLTLNGFNNLLVG